MSNQTIPCKIYLNETEMPKAWYNLRADMKQKPAPLLNPGTHQPMKAEELAGVFCEELIAQELDNDTAYFGDTLDTTEDNGKCQYSKNDSYYGWIEVKRTLQGGAYRVALYRVKSKPESYRDQDGK